MRKLGKTGSAERRGQPGQGNKGEEVKRGKNSGKPNFLGRHGHPVLHGTAVPHLFSRLQPNSLGAVFWHGHTVLHGTTVPKCGRPKKKILLPVLGPPVRSTGPPVRTWTGPRTEQGNLLDRGPDRLGPVRSGPVRSTPVRGPVRVWTEYLSPLMASGCGLITFPVGGGGGDASRSAM